MKTKRNLKPNGKRLLPSLECHFRLYDEYDAPLVRFIKREMEDGERSVQQQLRYMLRQAAEAKPNAR